MEPNVCLSANKQDVELLKLQDREALNFASLNSDCMQLIFEHLKWQDLVNVVETCKSFNDAACAVFKRKLSGYKGMVLGRERKKFEESKLFIMSRLMSFKVLRNFGHTISRLHLYLDLGVAHYMNEYCSESMEELSFHCCDLRMSDIKKPFKNVKTIEMVECRLHDQQAMFSDELFPKLRSLKLKKNFYFEPLIVHQMPKLLQLSFTPHSEGQSSVSNRLVEESDIIVLIKNIPQVEVLHLQLHKNHGQRILQCISKHLPSLRELNLIVYDETVVLGSTQELLRFDSVEDFRLSTYKKIFLSRNPFIFKKLKSFNATNWIFHDDCMNDFFGENRGISLLVIHCEFITMDILKSTNVLQNVEEFRLFHVAYIQIVPILNIVKQSFRLKKFYIRGFIEGSSFQQIRNAITLSGAEFNETTKQMMVNYDFSVTVHILELFIKNSQDSIMRSVLEIVEDGSSHKLIRWHSNNSRMLRLNKMFYPSFFDKFFFAQLDQ